MSFVIDQKKIAIISNPQGGYNKRNNMKAFEDIASKHNIFITKAVKPEEILTALKEIAINKPDVLVINGGDGTVDVIIRLIRCENIFEKEPVLALIKGGTTNLIHRDLGFKGKPDTALSKLIKSKLKIITRSPLKIISKQNDDCPLYGFFMGTGAIPRAIEKARATFHKKNIYGVFSELIMLMTVLWRLYFKRDLKTDKILSPSLLKMNGQDKSHVLLALTSLKKLIPFVTSLAKDNKIGGIYVGAEKRKLEKKSYDSLTLTMDNKWVLDGEMQHAGEIEVSLGKPLKFLVLDNG